MGSGLRAARPPSITSKGAPWAGRGLRRLWHALLRTVAGGLFLFYCAWQVYWLGKGQIPPALFLAATGWPAPTTGGTRAVLALLQGDWAGSLRHNALAVPMVLLFALSVGLPAWQVLRGRRARLPQGVFVAWVVVLAVAWVVQLSRAAFQKWFV